MSLDFKVLGFDKKAQLIDSWGSAKVAAITGFGVPGIYVGLPERYSFIPSDEFCEIIRYFLENTDISKGDVRLKLLKEIRQAKKVKGYNGPKSRRLLVR